MTGTGAPARRVSRRGLLTGGAAAAGGALAGAGALAALSSHGVRPDDAVPVAQVGSAVEPFPGARQSGVTTEPQALPRSSRSRCARTRLTPVYYKNNAVSRGYCLVSDAGLGVSRCNQLN